MDETARGGNGERETKQSLSAVSSLRENSCLSPSPSPVLPLSSSSQPAPLLHFQHVSKWYGPVIGVNQITLELRRGITGLVGSNGAGKSTLMKLATGQLRPDIGRVTVFGHEAWSPSAKMHVGYCPDSDSFYEEMSGRRFVETMARLFGYPLSEARRRAGECLEMVGMAGRAERRLAGYSKGMRQRIKLAQAMVHDPQLLILDEPLAGIDPIGRQEFLVLFQKLAAQDKCLIISSHELEQLEKLTDHVAVMARGRIAAVGTVSQIRDLLDDHPLSILIASDRRNELARALLNQPDIVGIDLADSDALVVRARNPRRFFQDLAHMILEENIEIRHLEALDDSAHAVLGYLLGGSR